MKTLPFLVLGVFVAALLSVSGVSYEQVLNAVGLHDAAEAITLAKSGFEKAAAALSKINSR